MKKNMMIIGMLVSLLIVPNYTFAQAQVAAEPATPAVDEPVAPVAVDSAAMVADIDNAALDSAAAEEVMAPVKEKKVREPRVQKVDSLHYSYGSVVSAHFGMGMSGLWATQSSNAQLENSWGFPGFSVGVRYSYFFLHWLGFTTGLDYSTFNSTIKMKGVMDFESGKGYVHRLNFSEEGEAQSTWKEDEYLGMVEIPIALSFRYKPNKVGFLSTLGLKLGVPVVGRYRSQGTLNHSGYWKNLNYLEYNDNHFIANDSYDKQFTDYKSETWSPVNAEVFAEIGMLFQVHQRVDLSLSVYGGYCVNDVNKTAYSNRAALGFRTAEQTVRGPQMDTKFMNAYNGLIGTNAIDHINPWNCGVKIGVHIYCAKENDAERAARLAKHDVVAAEPQVIYVRDTITVTDTLETIIHDTVIDVHEKVTRMLEKVIIYYKSGDAMTPIINPANLLNDAAAIIAANPQVRVSVEGHASSDGNPDYNKMLSQSRAMNVANILREKGVKDSQIEIRAYGSDHPLKFGDQNDKNKDRRVEIIPIAQ